MVTVFTISVLYIREEGADAEHLQIIKKVYLNLWLFVDDKNLTRQMADKAELGEYFENVLHM